ncbi:unnamed protein product, partial [Iphiclides podalirius]
MSPDYRQSRRELAPAPPRAGTPPRGRAPSPARPPPGAEAPRPEFALASWQAPRRASAASSGEERAYGALAKASAPLGANVARAGGDKTGGKALRRKVLNTERRACARLHNGASTAAPPLARRAARQRAAVRALLALSGAFYALALLAFYFLSLP